MTATAADYAWIRTWGGGLFINAYCLTLVRGFTPSELLDRLGVNERTDINGVEGTIEPAYGAWGAHGGTGCYVAATNANGWALMVEPNGWIGTDRDVIIPLSRGTSLVSHYRNVNALDSFHWIDDGDLRLSFEPLFAESREGTQADDLIDVMGEVGFDLREGPDRSFEHHTEAAFALGEYLTGVAVTPGLLATSDFLCGIAPLPTRG